MSTNKLEIKNLREAKAFKADEFTDIFNLISGDEDSTISIVVAKLNGKHINRVNYKSTKIFYILEGSMMIMSGGKDETVFKDSIVRIPSNNWVELFGSECKFMIICSPPFNIEDEEIQTK